jgi:hypothetical protein
MAPRTRMKRNASKAAARSVCAPLPSTAVTEVEQEYEAEDRLLRTLLLAVCRSMNLEAYRDDSRSPTTLFVTAPEATHDVLAARLDDLVPKLDDQLMALTASFIREHCGLEVPIRPRT